MNTLQTPSSSSLHSAGSVWLVEQAKSKRFLSVVDSELAHAFAVQFGRGVKRGPSVIICPDLGKALSKAFKDGLFTRQPSGLPGEGRGWPKWVYVYELNTSDQTQRTQSHE